jgi:beta-lactamase regulating signal transducer with metallopeptidase domain
MNAAIILTALFNGAWQGAALCACAYLVFRRLRTLNATTMFTVWSVLLAICLLLPFANYMFAARPYIVHVNKIQTQTVSTKYGIELPRKPIHIAKSFVPVQRTFLLQPPAPSLRERALTSITWLLKGSWIVLAVLGGIALVRLALLARDLAGMCAARRAAWRIESPIDAQLPIRRAYAFAASDRLKSPCVLGFVPALIVIPDELLDSPQNDLLSVVLHEAEHVRRYDDVQNVVHRIIDAIAFFCPGVRIALRELALYREQICDDAAVNGLGDPLSYAMTLTGMAQWAQGRGVPVPSLIFKRKQLVHRLEVLLDRAVNHSLHTNRRFAACAAAGLILIAAIVLRVQVPVVAQVLVTPPAPIAPKHVAPVIAKHNAPVIAEHVAPLAAKHKAPVVAKSVALATAAPVPTAPAVPITPPAGMQLPQMLHAEMLRAQKLHARMRHAHTLQAQMLRTHVLQGQMLRTHMQVEQVLTQRMMSVRLSDANGSDSLLQALQSAGLTHLSVDDLVALRDHGVSPQLIEAAHAYFGSSVTARSLVELADHGVDPMYLQALHTSGVSGIDASSAIQLRDSGVSPMLIAAAQSYFGRGVSAKALVRMANSGVDGTYLQALGAAGVHGISPDDAVQLRDHGVDAQYIARIRRYNPRATIQDIIRLRDSGF